MSAFEYSGYNREGRRCRGILDARDARDTRERLAARGILADQVRQINATGNAESAERLPAEARIRFYRELASLLSADVPIVDALGILFATPGAGVSPRVVARIRDAIREGRSLATALADAGRKIPAYEKAVLEAGQRAGALPEMLERLAGFVQARHDLGYKVRSALIYPLFVVGFAVVMVMAIVGFGLPAIGRLLSETGLPLPVMIRVSMQWGRGAVTAVLLAAAALALAGRAVFMKAARNPEWRIRIEQLAFKTPFLGGGYSVLVNLRFVRTMELLTVGGYPLVDSLPIAGHASGSAWVADSMTIAADRLRHGECDLAEAVALAPPLNAAALPAWIRSGEAAGAMGRMLGRLADSLEQRWDRFTVRMLNLLLPVVILMVGVFVLAATLSVLIPILNLNRMLLS